MCSTAWRGKTNSKIKFLANGDISTNSTDAVNGSQLYFMNNQLAAYQAHQYTDMKFKVLSYNIAGVCT
ncbi:hypothetical protein [Candidatus Bartonella washoeensis]|uniref:hypothetical protein n=1 Tax=Candidatus Bartonella washoeensis TaxID=186739 RepID=UPI003075B3D6